MQVFRYWARARVNREAVEDPDGAYVAVGWSDRSQEEAQRLALSRAVGLSDCFEGRSPHKFEQYYADRPPREPVVDVLEHDGRAIATTTRNVYGAHVLNAGEAMFVDLDTQPVPPRAVSTRVERWVEADPAVARVAEVVAGHAGMAMRLYQTAAGYRGLITDRLMEPTSDASKKLLRAFRADKLYAKLCLAQNTYRARLSPKPWRCGIGRASLAYPWATDAHRKRFEAWDAKYAQACRRYATCRYLGTLGGETVHPSIEPVVELHDRATRSTENLDLA